MADVLGFVKKVLPWIGSAAAAVATGGPVGLIGVAVKGIGAIVGKDVAPTADSIAAAVAGATPDQLMQMKKLDQDFAAQMQQMGFTHEEEIEKLVVADRDSARNREIQVRDRTPRILSYFIVGGFMGMAYGVLFHKMQADSALAGAVIGYLSAKAELVASYYFGASHGQNQQNDVIAEAMHKQNG